MVDHGGCWLEWLDPAVPPCRGLTAVTSGGRQPSPSRTLYDDVHSAAFQPLLATAPRFQALAGVPHRPGKCGLESEGRGRGAS
jgi:hypothetical protein